jgi:uncharacterized protein
MTLGPQPHRLGSRIEMLVLQATPFCNLDCSYCYLPDRSSKTRMSEATLARTFECVFSSSFLCDQLTILWHAGEPLVPGVSYYERAFDILAKAKPARLTISHSFQTNGTLLDQAWIDFFRAQNVKVGLSIDGPAHLNDLYRKTRRQGGTFEQIMRGIRVLQANDFSFHVITVLTRESLRCARELFDFYVDNGIRRVAFNVEEIEGEHVTSSLQGDIDAEVRAFYREFLALAEAHPIRMEVREFVGAFSSIVNPASADYGNPMAAPLRMVSVGVNGEISTFSPELLGHKHARFPGFVFGNVHTHELTDILNDANFQNVHAEVERGLERCKASCEYFELCMGGSPVNKLFENGTFDSTETLFCRLSKKAVIDVVLERAERGLELAG